MFGFSLSFNSYKKANSYHPHKTEEESGWKKRALFKVTSQGVEGARLEPRPTSSRSVIAPSAVMPKPSAEGVPERDNQ